MARNVEIKARVADPDRLRRLVESLADQGPQVLEQHDTFYSCALGRLKLRRVSGSPAELIAYARPDTTAARPSDYRIAPVADAERLASVLERALGVTGTVRKRRTLYRIGRTRVHLDEVEGLGTFVELEVVLGDPVGGDPAPGDAMTRAHPDAEGVGVDRQVDAGVAEAHRLMRRLEITPDSLVAGAYLDLLAGRGADTVST